MDEVMAYIQGIDWEKLGTLCTDFINGIDFEGFFNEIVNFVKDLAAVIAG